MKISIYTITGIALTATFVTFFLFPTINKYEAELVRTETFSDFEVWYEDLNDNGQSERIFYHYNLKNQITVIVWNKGKVVGQMIVRGNHAKRLGYLFGDHDANGIKEVYVFTYINDSIFINWFEPYNEVQEISTTFITKFKPTDRETDFRVFPAGAFNMNKEAGDELIFVINETYSFQPRKLYILDIINDSLYSSPDNGTAITNPFLYDINEDGLPEIFVTCSAFNNGPDDYPFPDQFSWLSVFDHKANFMFEPIQVGIYPSTLHTTPFKTDKGNYIACLHIYYGPNKDNNCFVQLYSTEGKLLRERDLGHVNEELSDAQLYSNHFGHPKRLFLILQGGIIWELDEELKTIAKFEIPNLDNFFISNLTFQLDFENDGKPELAFAGKNYSEIILSRNNFSHQVSLPTDGSFITAGTIIRNLNKEDQIYFLTSTSGLTYSYSLNPLYYFRYPLYLGIFGLIYLMLFLIYQYQVKIKLEQENRMANLQIKSIQNQTNSHFMFNIVTAIGSLMDKKEKEKAQDLFNRYSKLLRSAVITSDKIEISLKQELENVDNYLRLESFRLNNQLKHQINVADKTKLQIKIPKLLIHTFAENAVKHGIRHKEGNGQINIEVFENSLETEIIIEDNGIGRVQAKQFSKLSTGQGLRILDEILETYQALKKRKITYLIEDLHNAKGTRVKLKIQV